MIKTIAICEFNSFIRLIGSVSILHYTLGKMNSCLNIGRKSRDNSSSEPKRQLLHLNLIKLPSSYESQFLNTSIGGENSR